jgi:hypothetical protein
MGAWTSRSARRPFPARRFCALAELIVCGRKFQVEQKLKIAVFVDFDNIETGVKSTRHREFDVAAVLDAATRAAEPSHRI